MLLEVSYNLISRLKTDHRCNRYFITFLELFNNLKFVYVFIK